jgi:hypothetical protein
MRCRRCVNSNRKFEPAIRTADSRPQFAALIVISDSHHQTVRKGDRKKLTTYRYNDVLIGQIAIFAR